MLLLRSLALPPALLYHTLLFQLHSGDIILVKIGDIVPADCRVIPQYLAGLECDEALLTGESLPSVKTPEAIDDPVCPVGDRTNMIYSGSQVAKGRVRAVCVATGMKTELGKISEAMNRKEKTNKQGFAARWHNFKAFLGVVDTTPLQIKWVRGGCRIFRQSTV